MITGGRNLGILRRKLRSLWLSPKRIWWKICYIFDNDNFCESECNICGARSTVAIKVLGEREARSCMNCGSSVRFRSVVAALLGIIGENRKSLKSIRARKSLRVLGCSDTRIYAEVLEEKFDYLNTFYHTTPLLDLTNPSEEFIASADILVCSDVLEHVPPPVEIAVQGCFDVLRPGGSLVVSVPYTWDGSTVEHFPSLHRYEVVRRGDKHILHNTTVDGASEVFHDLVFHGGPGSTLEMRVFSFSDLRDLLTAVGFEVDDAATRRINESFTSASNNIAYPVVARKPR